MTSNKQDYHGLDAVKVWDTASAFEHLETQELVENKRTAERMMQSLGLFGSELDETDLLDTGGRALNELVVSQAIDECRKRRHRILFVQIGALPSGKPCLFANDPRGARFWYPLADDKKADACSALEAIAKHLDKTAAVFPTGKLVDYLRDVTELPGIVLYPQAYPATLNSSDMHRRQSDVDFEQSGHLKRLEAESIHIIREAIAEAQNPAMLYSVGKDSGVMLHLARKAFHPSPPPFPLVHVDTRWKFQEMYLFRNYMAKESGMELIVHTNPEAIEKNINPFDHGSALHTDITKTVGLKQILDEKKYDVIFGGARRDEEKSRAKERVFSFRTATHRWDPKNQRPELWNLYNARKRDRESIRVFPLSNWTELDIWQYIYQENIPMVPLYFAKPRPVVVRPDMTMMVDDARCQLLPDEKIEIRKVRFRTLGCYPLTGAVESEAETLEDIIFELINARDSERQGRKIDTDSAASMEKKKQEGYF